MSQKKSYRVIGFGSTEHGFFNSPRYCSEHKGALAEYRDFYNDPDVDGCVLIEVCHETWRVVEEFGTENKSIVYGPLGNFKVEKAPKLVMIS